ncbi:aminotransferase class I/II-fold pyridoxal phosphate-dependent enzyme [Microbacterium mangrovi]|uniref:aminotransferase class I/II-fold pyridoxal phosphate-dependent enzyme n=1 Tax=Microbacterium mangrovi TaxID=1348253 RepID=UPI000AB888CE
MNSEPTAADPMATLRRRTSEKWRSYPDDVLPMFVAEMDFPLAPAIKTALHEAVELGDTGYINPFDRGAARAFSDFAAARWGWTPDPRRMGITTDVSVVIVESLRRLIAPGDGVIITPPVYPPFYDMVPEAGGTVVEVPLTDDGAQYRLDLAGIDRALAAGARGILLCSPHNPVGLVHDRATLAELSRIVARHGGLVIADEIHAPLTHHGVEFTPYLTVSDEAREHAIAAESGSKAFNLAGLRRHSSWRSRTGRRRSLPACPRK